MHKSLIMHLLGIIILRDKQNSNSQISLFQYAYVSQQVPVHSGEDRSETPLS